MTKKHCLKRFIIPSLPNACRAVHRGSVGNLLDKESDINPEIRDKVVSLEDGRKLFASVNLYSVYIYNS